MFTSAKAFIKSAFCGLEAGDSPLTEDLRNSFLNARGNAQKAEIRDKLGRARTVVHTVGRAIGDVSSACGRVYSNPLTLLDGSRRHRYRIPSTRISSRSELGNVLVLTRWTMYLMPLLGL